MRYDNVLQAVGRTPLIRLNRINQGLKPTIYAKVEYFNPGGSVKDRIAINMINEAEKRGDLFLVLDLLFEGLALVVELLSFGEFLVDAGGAAQRAGPQQL